MAEEQAACLDSQILPDDGPYKYFRGVTIFYIKRFDRGEKESSWGTPEPKDIRQMPQLTEDS
jgi:hypothetical protein